MLHRTTSSDVPWILGLSASHNGAACLLHGDEIVVVVQEERLSRQKRHRLVASERCLCIEYCLEFAGITASQLAAVAVSTQGRLDEARGDVRLNPQLRVGAHCVPVYTLSHHAAHAISAFATSGFAESAVLVIDGMGSPIEDFSADEARAVVAPEQDGWETVSIYRAEGPRLIAVDKHLVARGGYIDDLDGLGLPAFGSLGGMFNAASRCIFGDYSEAGKVMGLAPYGTPNIPASEFFTIRDGAFVFHKGLPASFPRIERWPANPQAHSDLAASVQAALEEAILFLVERARERCCSDRLCYAGGVALNSVANERVIRESGFGEVYIMPAAEDSGPAIGAAYHALWQLTGRGSQRKLGHDAVGRPYAAAEIRGAIESCPAVTSRGPDDTIAAAVDLLCAGKIIGWFQGRSELGPRALGQRSILCDPRRPDGKQVLNERVKHREGFRPFAPAILLEHARAWFELEGVPPDSPGMLRVARFREDKRELVPAVVHVDGTGRLQTLTQENNGRFYELVRAFGERTGVPILLNTSFNVMGEPIVETPEDALWALLYTGLDACVLGDEIVEKAAGYQSVLDLYPRVIARGYWLAFSNAPTPGRLGDKVSGVRFEVATPWGVTTMDLPPRWFDDKTMDLLGLIDGRTSGAELARACSLEQREAITRIGVLRRARVIACAGSPA